MLTFGGILNNTAIWITLVCIPLTMYNELPSYVRRWCCIMSDPSMYPGEMAMTDPIQYVPLEHWIINVSRWHCIMNDPPYTSHKVYNEWPLMHAAHPRLTLRSNSSPSHHPLHIKARATMYPARGQNQSVVPACQLPPLLLSAAPAHYTHLWPKEAK